MEENDLNTWAIVFAGGACMIGELHVHDISLTRELSPVFAFQAGLVDQPDPNGSGRTITVAMRSVQPMCALASITSIDLPDSAVIIPIVGCSREEKRVLINTIENAKQLAMSLRAAESAGIMIARG